MERGVYKDLPMADYHSAKDFVSSTELVEMDVSPRHFFHFWKKHKSESTEAQTRGTLFHDLLLEQSIEKYVARPLNEKGEMIRSNTKEYAAFLAANPGKTPIHPNDHQELYAALTAFCDNKKAMQILNKSKVEHSIFASDPETGIKLRARPDMFGDGFIADLKTTSNIRKFDQHVFTLGYDVRIIHYAKCLEFATGQKTKDFLFIAFESSAPFGSMVFRLDPEAVAYAENKWRTLINKLSVCMKTNSWPGFEEDILIAKRPKFLTDVDQSFEEAI
jgi:hypothetical protein